MLERTLVLIRNITKNGLLVCSVAVVSENVHKNEDIRFDPPKEEKEKQTGWNRLRIMYSRDEFGNFSPEMSAVIQTSFLSLFAGCVYGGFKASKAAYLDFLERNQATVYDNMFDAKRRLQNHVTINFGRGAFHWGWRLGLFCGSFQLLLTTVAAYKGYSGISDYVISGLIVGSLYKFHLGPRGMIVGGTLGTILGMFAGALSQYLLSFCNSSFDELIESQNKLQNIRIEDFNKAVIKSQQEKVKPVMPLLNYHDQLHNVGSTNKEDSNSKKEVK